MKFTAKQLTEVAQLAATLERNIAAFEKCKSKMYIHARAAGVTGAWEDILKSQKELGFEWFGNDAHIHRPTAVRAAYNIKAQFMAQFKRA